jgi:flagellar motor switch protein FliN
MTLRRENTREVSLLVERWRNALAVALSESGLTVIEHQCARVEDRAACGEASVWWSHRDTASGGSHVALGFGPAARDAISAVARAAEAREDFLQRILERASILADGTNSPEGLSMAPCIRVPDGSLHMARFRLENGQELEIALVCANTAIPERLPADPHVFPPDRLGILLKLAVPVTVLLGRANLPLKETLKLTRGSVVDLDRTFNDPVEVIVNDRVVARGDIVVVEEKYAVRIREIYRDASSQVWTGVGAKACA